jgi:ABC-2 type transport system permease protein
MFASIGAMVNSSEEVQQYQMPLIMTLVIPIIIMMYIIGNPDSTPVIVLSMIPFFSPTIMLTRILILMPPVWEIALSILILIVSIVGVLWLSGRIYRVGILMYGKRPSLPELIKWVKYS